MIKIFVDAHYIDEFNSGAATYLKGLFNELVKNDDIKIFLAAKNIDRLRENFPDTRFNFIKLSFNSTFLRLFFEIPYHLKKDKYDFAHFTYFVPFFKYCKYIVTIHDLLFLEFPQYFSFKYRVSRTLLFYFSSLRSDILLTISEYSKKSLVKFFKISEEIIFITPCATFDFNEVEKFEKRIISENYLLFVSRIEKRKNHIGLLKAFVELKLYENYMLIFIGAKSEDVSELYNYISIQPSNVREKILEISNTNDVDLRNFYQNASLFVFPSFAEGFGIPPLEALSNMTKVVCSNSTAMKEFYFLKDYQFNPSDQEEFKYQILKTLGDENYPFEDMLLEMRKKVSWKLASKTLYEQLYKSY
jgi:glycosyltransferase involved in cell wall biosynthesis